MRYVIVLGDGMADLPCDSLGGKTPLETAKKTNIDRAARYGTMGMMRTVYEGMAPGSDVANLCVMGYNPKVYYSGRSPLEAASIGVPLTDTDITYRANLVTLSGEPIYEEKTMLDYSAGEITTGEAQALIQTLKQELNSETFQLFAGISYRHLLIRKDERKAGKLTPPHDISDQPVKNYLPQDGAILSIMKKSHAILKQHPVNLDRIKRGLNPADSLWIWGEGVKPRLDSFEEKYHLTGSVISAVDLIKGIGVLTGLNVIEVPGATGTVHTNFDGKRDAAVKALKDGAQYLYIHLEAADESGHQGSAEDKVRSIELIDEKIYGPVLDCLNELKEPFRLLVLPDHPTPLKLKTHTADPIPFLLLKDTDRQLRDENAVYSEAYAQKSSIFLEEGHTLLEKVINNEL